MHDNAISTFLWFDSQADEAARFYCSIFVSCNTQDEVDALWDKFLSAGATETQCGWLVDKFGLSWQIIPTQLLEMLSDPDPAKAGRAGAAMMQMKKIDIAALQRAYLG